MTKKRAKKSISRAPVQRNPVIPRLRYVGKQFKDPRVLYYTTIAWLEAAGIHGHPVIRGIRSSGRRPEDLTWATPERIEELLLEANVPKSTRFDRFLPWLGREFNRIFKGRGLQLGTERQTVNQEAMTLFNAFRTITDWAEENRIDLNQIDWREAHLRATEWAERRDQKIGVEGNVVYIFPDRWTIQDLTTDVQLSAEGEAMGHCVGQYCRPVQHGELKIFSLRDPSGASHATMEWDLHGQHVEQLRGKQNARPKKDYVLRVAAFRRDILPSNALEKVTALDKETLSEANLGPESFSAVNDAISSMQKTRRSGIENHGWWRVPGESPFSLIDSYGHLMKNSIADIASSYFAVTEEIMEFCDDNAGLPQGFVEWDYENEDFVRQLDSARDACIEESMAEKRWTPDDFGYSTSFVEPGAWWNFWLEGIAGDEVKDELVAALSHYNISPTRLNEIYPPITRTSSHLGHAEARMNPRSAKRSSLEQRKRRLMR